MTTAVTPQARERQAPPGLAARLAAWIDAEGITGNYDTAAEIAALLVKTIHASHLQRWLDAGGSDYLRDAARHVKANADLTPAEARAEDWNHGNLRADVQRWGA